MCAPQPTLVGTQSAFFDAEAIRSVFTIAKGKAAKGYGDGWNGSLHRSKVITRLLEVPTHRVKLRMNDSVLWISDSEL